MKILLVNCVYGSGSTGKILKDLRTHFTKLGHDVYVAIGRGVEKPDENVHLLASSLEMKFQALVSRLSGLSYKCAPFSTGRLKKLIRQFKPDIINLHCVNANTIDVGDILTFLKVNNIPTVVTCHAEFLYTGGCGYSFACNKWMIGCGSCPQFHTPDSNLPRSYFFDRTHLQWHTLKEAYRNFTKLRLTGVSEWLTARMDKSPFFVGRKIIPVLNGLDTSIFHYYDVNDKRKLLNIEGKKVIIHVTPNFYFPIKGGRYVIELAKRFYTLYPEYVFIIIGYNGNGTDLPPNVIANNHTKNQKELAEYYSLADVCLLTSKKETFSMVTAEALCCGTPIAGFKSGGPESIAIPEYSTFCEFGDLDLLQKSIIDFANRGFNKKQISDEACKVFSKEQMVHNYLKVYTELLQS